MSLRLRKLCRWLRRHYPLRHKATVRVLPPTSLPGLCGEMEFSDAKKPRICIRIAQSSDEVMLETLIEEYAHAIRHECGVPVLNEHDHLFWAIYGHITMHYRGGE